MNIFARRSLFPLKLFSILSLLATVTIVSCVLLYLIENIEFTTLILTVIVVAFLLVVITATYAYLEGRRRTRGFLRF